MAWALARGLQRCLAAEVSAIAVPPFTRSLSSQVLRLNRERLNLVPEKPQIASVQEATYVEPDNARFTSKINRLGREGRWTEAEGIFSQVQVKNTVLYTALMVAAMRCERYEEAMRYFAEMLEVGIPRNAATYCCALTVLGRQGKYQEALRLWAEMGQLGDGQDNEACLTALLDAGALAGEVQAVESLLDDARGRGVQLNATHYGCLLKACRQAGDPEKALQVMHMVPNRNVVHYTLCMGACTKAAAEDKLTEERVEDHVQAILAAMAQDGVRPDKFFLEEEVRALLRVADLKHVLDATQGSLKLPSAVRAKATMAALQNSRLSGIYPSGLLRAVEQRLQTIMAEAAGSPRQPQLPQSQQPLQQTDRHAQHQPQQVPVQSPRHQAHELPSQQHPHQAPNHAAVQQPTQQTPHAAQAFAQAQSASTPPPPAPLPPGWSQALDPVSGRPYFWRLADPAGSTTWERPM